MKAWWWFRLVLLIVGVVLGGNISMALVGHNEADDSIPTATMESMDRLMNVPSGTERLEGKKDLQIIDAADDASDGSTVRYQKASSATQRSPTGVRTTLPLHDSTPPPSKTKDTMDRHSVERELSVATTTTTSIIMK